MNNYEKETNVYKFIDKQIGDLLSMSIRNTHKRIPVLQVIKLLCEIEDLIPEVVIDGDEMVKYFNKKSH
jgi:hypothetical protein